MFLTDMFSKPKIFKGMAQKILIDFMQNGPICPVLLIRCVVVNAIGNGHVKNSIFRLSVENFRILISISKISIPDYKSSCLIVGILGFF